MLLIDMEKWKLIIMGVVYLIIEIFVVYMFAFQTRCGPDCYWKLWQFILAIIIGSIPVWILFWKAKK